MTKPQVIVITGNISSGKTTAAKILKGMGYHVVSADKLVHKFIKSPVHQKTILKKLNKPMPGNKGTLIEWIRHALFKNAAFKTWYLPWVHNLVEKTIQSEINQWRRSPENHLFVEIPLFFESRFPYHNINQVWLIWTPKKLRYLRWKKRSPTLFQKMKKVERWQILDEDKLEKSDIIFFNHLSEGFLKEQINQALKN